MRIFKLVCVLLLPLLLNGCLLTKVVTVPMRVGGAIISVVPVCGDAVDAAIDESADLIDKAPL